MPPTRVVEAVGGLGQRLAAARRRHLQRAAVKTGQREVGGARDRVAGRQDDAQRPIERQRDGARPASRRRSCSRRSPSCARRTRCTPRTSAPSRSPRRRTGSRRPSRAATAGPSARRARGGNGSIAVDDAARRRTRRGWTSPRPPTRRSDRPRPRRFRQPAAAATIIAVNRTARGPQRRIMDAPSCATGPYRNFRGPG